MAGLLASSCFFFFQAEDGIRDVAVTGVQTCALPITNARLSPDDRASLRLRLVRARIAAGELDRADTELARDSSVEALALQGWIALYRGRLRSEERRVGKECRSRWSPYH